MMNIKGKITGIQYKVLLSEELKLIDIMDFNINNTPSTCLLSYGQNNLAISKWVSPKRTRSYPYERVYNSLQFSKKITVIPIVKDEGIKGDRDFLQWDTISLMSLLDIFVVFAYYDKAEVNPKNRQKITNQQFNNQYVLSKLKEITKYHSSALHWNLNELKTNFHFIIDKVKESYIKIEKTKDVFLHSIKGIDKFKEKIGKNLSNFMSFSRQKAKLAQAAEFVTQQPKESLSTLSKAKITISNYLGGEYYFTVDEIKINNKKINLIESKHTETSIIPNKGDVKDGLLKVLLYSNLKGVSIDGEKMKSISILKLTSSKLTNSITSLSKTNEIINFIKENNFSQKQKDFIENLFKEAKENSFIVKIEYAK